MVGKFLLGFWILRWISFHGDPVMTLTWPTPLQESLDERNDAEIFRAVVESMREWELHKKNCHRSKRQVSRVCYEDIGCFEDAGPFSYLEMLPSPPKDVGTRFFVYGNRKARSIPMEVPAEDINDKAYRAIDPDLPTKVIVHGFGSSCDHVWVYEMRSALMSVQECNIVCVDWGPGSAVPNYVRAAANTRLVGRQLAKLVRSLNVPLEKIHLIGFSLGAHVAGFAGAELGNVSRITGLDPAGPLFESQDPRARLDATDAHFVDVIHSNGEPLILGGLGSWQQMGDVDFYPNGGRMQTGCSNLFLGAVSDIIWCKNENVGYKPVERSEAEGTIIPIETSTVEGRSLCNHRRAYKLFTDSVSPKCRFPAFPCEHGYDGLLRGDCFPCNPNGADRSCGQMGFYSDKSLARGQLYLVTRDEEPFCAHQYQIKVHNSLGERPARSYGKLELTLVGEGSFNETFTMTRKDDEELLVGAILHKIVVPHPTVTNLEGIEIKYTAYSGWISSGLVSWNIDKVTVVDSFGKNLSVCKKGLILESGYPIYLPLYPGECNIPPDPETTLPPMTVSYMEQFTREKLGGGGGGGGIGPFTKDQNFEKEAHSVEVFSNERTKSQKGLGPFTKDHNVKAYDEDTFESPSVFNNVKLYTSSSENDRRRPSNSWSIADLNDDESNSLENAESEKGRGFSFSGSSFRRKMSSGTDHTTAFDFTTEFSGEIQEPVLKQFKKETGRSLRLPEITEPILRPRAVKQNVKRDSFWQDKQSDSAKATSSRAFTVQFLPERLAGILAQAERYARQTLLPLISQYTPSFIGGARHSEPKYFPPLGEIAEENLEDSRSREIANSMETVEKDSDEDRNESREEHEDESSLKDQSKETNSSEQVELTSMEVTFTTERIDYPEATDTSSSSETNATTINGRNEWASFEKKESHVETDEVANARKNRNDASRSHEGKSLTEQSLVWSPLVEDTSARSNFKADDWVPIIDENTNDANQSRKLDDDHPQRTNESSSPMIESTTKTENFQKTDFEGESKENVTPSAKRSERKFIPLIDFEIPDEFFVSTGTNDLPQENEGSPSTEVGPISHIQRIPGPASAKEAETVGKPTTTSRATTFPYVYESKKDPRTRYIPLIPAEDMGRPNPLMERDR